jgi:hypothetical protein
MACVKSAILHSFLSSAFPVDFLLRHASAKRGQPEPGADGLWQDAAEESHGWAASDVPHAGPSAAEAERQPPDVGRIADAGLSAGGQQAADG